MRPRNQQACWVGRVSGSSGRARWAGGQHTAGQSADLVAEARLTPRAAVGQRARVDPAVHHQRDPLPKRLACNTQYGTDVTPST